MCVCACVCVCNKSKTNQRGDTACWPLQKIVAAVHRSVRQSQSLIESFKNELCHASCVVQHLLPACVNAGCMPGAHARTVSVHLREDVALFFLKQVFSRPLDS